VNGYLRRRCSHDVLLIVVDEDLTGGPLMFFPKAWTASTCYVTGIEVRVGYRAYGAGKTRCGSDLGKTRASVPVDHVQELPSDQNWAENQDRQSGARAQIPDPVHL